jgi:hypothetical protein
VPLIRQAGSAEAFVGSVASGKERHQISRKLFFPQQVFSKYIIGILERKIKIILMGNLGRVKPSAKLRYFFL